MHSTFKQLVEENTPRANPLVMNGLACAYMPLAEEYVDAVFRSASRSFPAGLKYNGYQRCLPMEEFAEATRPKNNKRIVDLARSNIYYVKYFFSLNGKDLPPRYIYLPYVESGGIIHLGGTMFHMSPVMTDKVISPGPNSVFIKLLRDKVNFERCHHSLMINGEKEAVQIVWAQIYRRSSSAQKEKVVTRANISVMHYLLGKFGFTETFRRFAGFVPVIGEDEIDSVNYPKDKWVICNSTGIKPRSYISEFYHPSRIKLAIPIEHWNKFTHDLVAGLFYVIDHFPQDMTIQCLDSVDHWMVRLGIIIFQGEQKHGYYSAHIREHYSSLDEYMDLLIIQKLEELGYKVENFYELLALVIRHFNDWVINSGENITSMYEKTLEILYYALYHITSGIFHTNFKLNKAATKKGGVLTEKEVVETMNKQLKPGAIFKLTNAAESQNMTTVSYSGDNKYPKITASLVQQQNTSGTTRGKKTRTKLNSSRRAHPSMLEAGSILFLSKSNPTPAIHINMFANIEPSTGTFKPKPELVEILKKVDTLLKTGINEFAPTDFVFEVEDSIES